ncbi:hypothetical protein OG432_24530 [Streptomyces sp. NBC_00442]|uniref:hypothetical protein n=1 Tax=Streptomyces sp. NBC_00442 TaxID=2903651 RepID=UPI002E1C46FF
MNRNAWRVSISAVSIAALAMTGWSLYVVAHDTYGVPALFAYGAVAVFDGAAIACMYLASVAVQEGRAAIGAVLGTLVMASVSCYLNTTHARLLDAHMPVVPAAILFSSPTLALLLPSGLAWSAARYRARVERGEIPFRPPAFGGWVWLLAPARAGRSVKQRAVDHIEHAARNTGATPAADSKDRSATAVLRRRFAEMDPAEAIRIAHEAQPALPPAELASQLISYGVIVDAVQVALVLGFRPAEVTVEREAQQGAAPVAPQVTEERPALTKADAILDVAVLLGPAAPAADIVKGVALRHRLDVGQNQVRAVLSRAKKRPAPPGATPAQQDPDGDVGRGGEGYN